MRLTLLPGLHVALSTPDTAIAQRAIAELTAQARLLEALGAGPEGVLVVHTGGAHGDAAAAPDRFATRFERLPPAVRSRIAVEPDEASFDLAALLPLHQVTGVPLVFDALHVQLHNLHNPQRLRLPEALSLALATWPRGVRPKAHFSSQRTGAHALAARAGLDPRIVPPRHGQHADYINPFEFAGFVAAARGLAPFDLMLEAKAADLALLRLRSDIQRFAPELAALAPQPGHRRREERHPALRARASRTGALMRLQHVVVERAQRRFLWMNRSTLPQPCW